VSVAPAYAKINLALVVGSRRGDGKHEVVTVLERIGLHDTISIEHADELVVDGFEKDTIVRAALESLAAASARRPEWRARIEKRIPVASGLGGGSSDAATALSLANELLDRPLDADRLHRVAVGIGADVPFFLRRGAQVGRGEGTHLEPVALPTGYSVVLVVPTTEVKASTGAVYDAFDARGGAGAFENRAASLAEALASVRTPRDLAALPRNDLASSPLASELEREGAFRADVSGAGPTVYGLFEDHDDAVRASAALAGAGRTFVTSPVEAGERS
jgi:4-diphosphocytidyl-2-C-methyl-D-erythritol kinase